MCIALIQKIYPELVFALFYPFFCNYALIYFVFENHTGKLFLQPERIDPQGDPSKYDVRSDVWSFGISMIEISTGQYPYKLWKTPFEQLKQVVQEEPPRLPENTFSPIFEKFIDKT